MLHDLLKLTHDVGWDLMLTGIHHVAFLGGRTVADFYCVINRTPGAGVPGRSDLTKPSTIRDLMRVRANLLEDLS